MRVRMILLSASPFNGSRQNGFAGAGRCWLNLFASVCIWLACVSAGGGQPAPNGEIVTAHELKNLTPEQALTGRPIRLKGVVVCYDSGWNQLYVYDGQETVYFNPHNFQTQPEIGQLVEITGQTAGDNALTNASLTVLGQGNIPPAKKLELSQLGTDWCEWIETTGRVLSVDNSLGRPALLLYGKDQNCLVYVMGDPGTNDVRRLLDCKVRIRGINASKAVGGRLDSASVFVPGNERNHGPRTGQRKAVAGSGRVDWQFVESGTGFVDEQPRSCERIDRFVSTGPIFGCQRPDRRHPGANHSTHADPGGRTGGRLGIFGGFIE